ncbi:hypothetical protein HBA55_25125 [Pseudomaricurvus alkylphenolicus]|jgi:hypothetical protein|uniref:hypothetical protein n=1 Tax=Pseudomaricurvus alkylphenolicus TaxID=1306991 RepID=UPI00141F5A28|nr:hypothetical protein [Pseudomaricurvus alkylphenolicus]NIB42914.1 hypothetical protein [Pseudomaricurvus alkylphenolicus]
MSRSPSLVIDNQSVKFEAITQRLQKDIAFLSERLEMLENQPPGSTLVRKTYADMLENRRSVLKWLSDYNSGEQEDKSDGRRQS